MNNVFPFKGECGKIQVSSDWEAEWWMLTKKLEIAWLSIEGIQGWIITSSSQHQMGTVAPNLFIWTRWDSHEKTQIGFHILLVGLGEAQGWVIRAAAEHLF